GDVDLVVAVHLGRGAELPEVLDQVEGERVVVVDDQEPGERRRGLLAGPAHGRAPAARRLARRRRERAAAGAACAGTGRAAPSRLRDSAWATAVNTARALLSVSWYSASGRES